ncbi:hypothetical protein OROGR_015812 [Orobanche gracilis]
MADLPPKNLLAETHTHIHESEHLRWTILRFASGQTPTSNLWQRRQESEGRRRLRFGGDSGQVWAEGLNRLVVLDSSGRVAARPRCGYSSRPGPGFPPGSTTGSAKRLGAGVQTAQPATKVRKDRRRLPSYKSWIQD